MFTFLFFNPFLIAAAVIPAVFLIFWIYKHDRLDKESPALIRSLVLKGFLAAALACAAELILPLFLDLLDLDDEMYDFVMYFFVVALSEEFFKYFVMKRKTWYSEEFNCQFDGVVYATSVSLGFALIENIAYVFEGGLGTALLRAITAIPGHACFGVFMGAWYGMAKRFDNFGYPEKSRLHRFLAVFVPVLLHGAYDYIATREDDLSVLVFFGFVAVLFVITFLLVKRLSREDRYIV